MNANPSNGQLDYLSCSPVTDPRWKVSTLFSQEMQSTPQEMLDFYSQNRSVLDQSTNGLVSDAELLSFINKTHDPNEKQVAAEMRDHIGDIEELSDDETGDENSGISLKDLEVLNNEQFILDCHRKSDSELRAQIALKPEEIAQFFQTRKGKLNQNGDDYVDNDELERFFREEEMTARERKIVQALRLYSDEIEELSNDEYGDEDDGISLNDINQLANNWNSDSSLNLTRSMDYLVNKTDGLGVMGKSKVHENYLASIDKYYTNTGLGVGLVLGTTGGAALSVPTYGIMFPVTTPAGAYVGAWGGAHAGHQIAKIRQAFTSQNTSIRDHINSRLGIHA